jgi:hypothetical protein
MIEFERNGSGFELKILEIAHRASTANCPIKLGKILKHIGKSPQSSAI